MTSSGEGESEDSQAGELVSSCGTRAGTWWSIEANIC